MPWGKLLPYQRTYRPLARGRHARHTSLLAPLLLVGCKSAVLAPLGLVGVAERTILIDSLAIMLAIVVPTIIAVLAFAWWFRAANTKARHLPTWAFSGQIELIVWAVPLLVIILLGGVAWIGAHTLDPARPLASKETPLEVQVVSLDWKWLFIYPGQGIAAVNQFVVPAGVPVHFTLTSASVMNAFFVPRLGSMIYTMNRMTTQLSLQADQPGTFPGLSSHYSGDGFSDMHFEMRAVPAAQFDAWVKATGGAGPILDSGSYAELSKQTTRVTPFTYGKADADLFRKIVAQELPPGPGPQSADLAAAQAAK